MASKKAKTTLSDVKTLGRQLLSSRAHINNLPLLLSFVSSTSPPQYVLESLLSLQSFFLTLLPDLPSSSSAALDASNHDPELIYRVWIRSKFDDFIKSIIDVSASPQTDEALKVSSSLYFLWWGRSFVCYFWFFVHWGNITGGCVRFSNGICEGGKWGKVPLCYISQAST